MAWYATSPEIRPTTGQPVTSQLRLPVTWNRDVLRMMQYADRRPKPCRRSAPHLAWLAARPLTEAALGLPHQSGELRCEFSSASVEPDCL